MAVLRYLAYGSNLHPERLQRRTPSAVAERTCQLRGWRLSFEKRGQDGSGKATIVETGCRLDVVHAALYRMDPEDKPALDRIEGLNRGYREHRLTVSGIGPVWTYRAEPLYTDRGLLPFGWYRDLVVEGARHHGFPTDYIEYLERLEVTDDPDRLRHREHTDLLESIRAWRGA